MKNILTALAIAAAALATSAQAADAASGPAMGKHQTKMATCNADAKTKDLKGDERKAFMKECLSNKPATQQDKMKSVLSTSVYCQFARPVFSFRSTSFSPCFTMVPSGTMKMTVDWPSTSERTMVSRSACSSAFSRTVIGRSSRRKVNRLPSWACCSAVEAPQAASSAARASRERW